MTEGTAPVARQEDPVLSAIRRLEQRLARIEDSVSRAEGLARQAVPTAATALDVLDDVARQADERGIDVDQRMRTALRLLERATQPETARMLERTLDLAETAPQTLATVADVVDGLIAKGAEAGIDVDERLRVIVRVAERLTSPGALSVAETLVGNLDAISRLLGSGILAPGPVEVVSRAGGALASAGSNGAPKTVGAWGALRSLSDPRVQRALGFALDFARRFGDSLDALDAVPALVASTEDAE
ncbi:MAG: DUF1641 domain-containing protein [Myxococcales bacterium]|nr:DUF1641 domain-containing protein [Myxococcales bacterium]MCB9577026.1 DUF1641 domain-containing protein [Polyangiaceae bacterium]